MDSICNDNFFDVLGFLDPRSMLLVSRVNQRARQLVAKEFERNTDKATFVSAMKDVVYRYHRSDKDYLWARWECYFYSHWPYILESTYNAFKPPRFASSLAHIQAVYPLTEHALVAYAYTLLSLWQLFAWAEHKLCPAPDRPIELPNDMALFDAMFAGELLFIIRRLLDTFRMLRCAAYADPVVPHEPRYWHAFNLLDCAGTLDKPLFGYQWEEFDCVEKPERRSWSRMQRVKEVVTMFGGSIRPRNNIPGDNGFTVFAYCNKDVHLFADGPIDPTTFDKLCKLFHHVDGPFDTSEHRLPL